MKAGHDIAIGALVLCVSTAMPHFARAASTDRARPIASSVQNADTLRTSIRNFTTLFHELKDVRATGAFADEFIDIDILTGAGDYIRASDGRIQLRMEAFEPGTVGATNWEIRVDVFEATVNR